MSLKYKLIFGSALAVIIPFFIAGTIIYLQLSGSLLEHKRKDTADIARNTAEFIDSYLNQKIDLVSAIAANPETINSSKSGDYSTAQKMLKSVHKRIGNQYFTIFITDRNGIAKADAVFNQQLGLDLSEREYFQKARQGLACIAGPIQAKGKVTPGAPILVVAVPIIDNNEFLGIVAIPFDTDFITKILSGNNIGLTGESFLINTDGLVLVHPHKEYILNLHLLDQPGTNNMKTMIQSGNGGSLFVRFNDMERIAGLARVHSTDWFVVFSEGMEEAVSPMKKTLFFVFISGLFFLFLAIGTIILFTSKVGDPIDKNMELMRQVTKHSTEFIVQIGVDRRILFVNPAYEKFTGLSADKIVGKDAIFNQVDNRAVPVWDLLESGTPWSGRITITRNSEILTLEVMVVPLRDLRGKIQGYLAIGRDITSELLFEKRLLQSQKMEAIGNLSGGIAHDFNNILSGIFAYAELCLMKKHSASDTEKYVKKILIAANRARELVNQILAFSRKAEFELQPLSPIIALKEAINLLRATIPASIDIQTKYDSSATILADPTQLHQVIMNLVTNAVHAIGDNKGTIKVELEELVVDEAFIETHPDIRPGRHIMIRISDTGSGIEPESINKIFEPFYTTKGLGEGAGLGLAVVHGIINSFNGIITVYSQPGKGSSFNIIIPCKEGDTAKISQMEPAFFDGNERIVLIDDEETIVLAMEAILTNLGYTVTTHTDSENALRIIQEKPEDFDVIITDYSMPKLTGLELAQKVMEAGIKTPIIMTSGYFSENVEKEAKETGISFLISKPINTYKITKAIRQACDDKNKIIPE